MLIDLKLALKKSEYSSVAAKLQKEFDRVGLFDVEQIHNAPLIVKTTYGADIYKVMELVKAFKPGPTNKEEVNKDVSSQSKST